jgi:streptogramin lyase
MCYLDATAMISRLGLASTLILLFSMLLYGVSFVAAQNNYFNEITVPYANSAPHGIVVDSTGAIWFALSAGNAIARFDPVSAQFLRFTIPNSVGENRKPTELAVDSEGNIWFTEYYGNRLGVLRVKSPLSSSQFEEYLIPTANSQPGVVAFDAFGDVWVTESATNKVTVFYPQSKTFKE